MDVIHPTPDAGLLRKRVLSGLGEDIGVVIHVEMKTDGVVDRLWILEDGDPGGGHLREVQARFVRGVVNDRVLLKGPREGYHITRIGEPPQSPVTGPGPF